MLLLRLLSLLSLLSTLPLGVWATEHSNLHHDAVHPEAYGYPAAQTVFAQNEAKRVAIVGAGASGAAAAFFLRRAARVAEKRAGLMEGELLGEVVVYETADWVGGRE
jgi:prenylcysteine oxidase/farnesylcysteine lyase